MAIPHSHYSLFASAQPALEPATAPERPKPAASTSLLESYHQASQRLLTISQQSLSQLTSNRVLHFGAGAVLTAGSITGMAVVGTLDWGYRLFNAASLGEALNMMFVESFTGLIDTVGYLGQQFYGVAQGSLKNQSSFKAGQYVAELFMTSAMILMVKGKKKKKSSANQRHWTIKPDLVKLAEAYMPEVKKAVRPSRKYATDKGYLKHFLRANDDAQMAGTKTLPGNVPHRLMDFVRSKDSGDRAHIGQKYFGIEADWVKPNADECLAALRNNGWDVKAAHRELGFYTGSNGLKKRIRDARHEKTERHLWQAWQDRSKEPILSWRINTELRDVVVTVYDGDPKRITQALGLTRRQWNRTRHPQVKRPLPNEVMQHIYTNDPRLRSELLQVYFGLDAKKVKPSDVEIMLLLDRHDWRVVHAARESVYYKDHQGFKYHLQGITRESNRALYDQRHKSAKRLAGFIERAHFDLELAATRAGVSIDRLKNRLRLSKTGHRADKALRDVKAQIDAAKRKPSIGEAA